MADETKDQVKLTSSSSQVLTVEPAQGYTAAQVAKMVLAGEAHVSDRDIVVYAPPPAEGFSRVGKVVEIKNEHKPWGVFVEHKHEGGCCARLTPQQKDRNLAASLRFRANEAAGADNFALAEQLLVTVETLLEQSGGFEHDGGIWLYGSRCDLLNRQNKHAEAESFARKAIDLSVKVYGEEHPCTGVCYANLAEVMLGLTKNDDAKTALDKAGGIMDAATPVGDYNAEYIASIRGAIDQMRTKLPQDIQ